MLCSQPFVKGMGGIALDVGNVGHRKGQIKVHGAKFLDLIRGRQFLPEIIRRNRQNHETTPCIGVIKRLKIIVLWRIATQRCRIHHQNRASLPVVQRILSAFNRGEGKARARDGGQTERKHEYQYCADHFAPGSSRRSVTRPRPGRRDDNWRGGTLGAFLPNWAK